MHGVRFEGQRGVLVWARALRSLAVLGASGFRCHWVLDLTGVAGATLGTRLGLAAGARLVVIPVLLVARHLNE